MRTLFVGALAATVVGCSSSVSPRASLDACAGTTASGLACPDRSSVNRTIEPEPASVNARLPTPKPKPKIAAATEKPSSADARQKSELVMNMATSTTPAAKTELAANVEPVAVKVEPAPSKVVSVAAKAEPALSARAARRPDPVIARAKATIASRLDDPKSVEFAEMKRAMRMNARGRSVDTICGVVKSKKASGEGPGDRPFLYLVKNDEAYVVDGPPTSIAATAYRNICN